jgi:DNA-binding winged helix-turn-helix (wHTH) protein
MLFRFIELGPYWIDTEVNSITEAGKPLDIPPTLDLKPLAVRILIRLIEKHRQVVRVDDISDLLTQSTNDEDRLKDYQNYVSILRRCLNSNEFKFDDFIRTVSKKSDRLQKGGYEFVGDAQFLDDAVFPSSGTFSQSPSDQSVPLTFTRDVMSHAIAASKLRHSQVYPTLVKYYDSKEVPLFKYRCSPVRVPLFVRRAWTSLTNDSIKTSRDPVDHSFPLSNERERFFALYTGVRKELGRSELWDGRIFRLTKLKSVGSKLNLHFEHGHFFDALKYQDYLDFETRLALSNPAGSGKLDGKDLRVRKLVASSVETIERFCESQVCGMGISNLILFRTKRGTYRPAIRARGRLSLSATDGIFDNIGTGIFDIANADSRIDLEFKYKVIKEIYEELFDGKEVEREIRNSDPFFFFRKPGIRELVEMLETGEASFHVTGFCIDLLRLGPEVTTVFVVQDSGYLEEFESKFKLNKEYESGPWLEIPSKINDVDTFLADEFPSNPSHPNLGLGFDPSNWTLPGAFCFYQGLHLASAMGLFR